MKNILLIAGSLFLIALSSCKKESVVTPEPPVTPPPVQPAAVTLSYGDSIFYLSTTASNVVSPKPVSKPGRYFGFPEGIEIDSANGNINLLESEMGLRYKIMFVANGTTDTVATKIVLAGINFYDGIYNLSKGDTIAKPIYNANGQFYTPGQFGTGTANVFDDGKGCNKRGCAVSYTNGTINLAKSLRDGAIASKHDSQDEFVYYYRMDDKSGKALNKLKVKLYYYNTRADIPQYLWDILNIEHAGTILRPTLATLAKPVQVSAKPRPPCIILIAN